MKQNRFACSARLMFSMVFILVGLDSGAVAIGVSPPSSQPGCVEPMEKPYGIERTELALEGIPVQMYLPKLTGCHPPLPFILFAHGYHLSYLDYEPLWQELVPRGYVLVFPTALSSAMMIDIDHYAALIETVIRRLLELNSTPGAELSGRLSGAYALMGHSTGSGATFLAAANMSNEIKQPRTIVSWAPLGKVLFPVYGTDPISQIGKVKVATLIIGGEEDCICPVSDHAKTLYREISSKQTKVYAGNIMGTHCGFTYRQRLNHTLCSLVEAIYCLKELRRPSFEAENLFEHNLRLTTLWLEHYLSASPPAREQIEAALQLPGYHVLIHNQAE